MRRTLSLPNKTSAPAPSRARTKTVRPGPGGKRMDKPAAAKSTDPTQTPGTQNRRNAEKGQARSANRGQDRPRERNTNRNPERDFNRKPKRDSTREPGQAPYRDKARHPDRDANRKPNGDKAREQNRHPNHDHNRDQHRDAKRGDRATNRPANRPARPSPDRRPAQAASRNARTHRSAETRAETHTETRTEPRTEAPARRSPPAPAEPREGIRMNKYLADAGWCSRREADHWVERGWVRINGQTAQMGQRVLPGDAVDIAPAAHASQARRITIVLHKPVGYVSAQAEDGHRPAIELITDANQWSAPDSRPSRTPKRRAPASLKGFAPAGRLDIDSTGLLILTQDGRLARHIIGEASEVDKEYLVRVSWRTDEGQTITENVQAHFPPERLQQLCHGLSLDGQPLLPAQVQWQNPEQLRFVLREGKKRQIRRMCELVGLQVTALKRIRIGRLLLGNLPAGQWRYLGEDEAV